MYLYGGIEASGTRFACAVAEQPDEIIEKASFPTTMPQETLMRSIEFFERFPLKALGIASFGPLDVNPSSPTYGYIMETPKPGWARTDLLGTLRRALNVPLALDTDANAAALAEYFYGAGRGADSLVYLTVGTGINCGVFVRGQFINHPEVGHMFIRRHPKDKFPGHCPYHADCLEGMASGPALNGRWGTQDQLAREHSALEIEAYYLAQAVSTIRYLLAPKLVILGGGVMHWAQQALPVIRQEVLKLFNGYISNLRTLEAVERFVILPALGDNAGICGALELGMRSFWSTSNYGY